MPLILVSGYFVIRYSYQRALQGDNVGPPGYYPDDIPLTVKAAEFVAIGTVYWIWVDYLLRIRRYLQKKPGGSCYVYAGSRSNILVPASDRLIGNICDAMGWPFNAIARRKRQRTNPKFYFFDNGVQRALAEELNIDLAPRMPLKRSDTKNN
jgi:hypothetical protein